MKTKKIKITATISLCKSSANALYIGLKRGINKTHAEHVVNVKNETDCLFIDIDMKDETIKDRKVAKEANAEMTYYIVAFAGSAARYATLPNQEKDYIAQENN